MFSFCAQKGCRELDFIIHFWCFLKNFILYDYIIISISIYAEIYIQITLLKKRGVAVTYI